MPDQETEITPTKEERFIDIREKMLERKVELVPDCCPVCKDYTPINDLDQTYDNGEFRNEYRCTICNTKFACYYECTGVEVLEQGDPKNSQNQV